MRKSNKGIKNKAKRRMITLLSTMFLITIGIMIFGNSLSDAHGLESEQHVAKYYKSIQIEAGDTLWDIAKEYKLDYENTVDYIKELKRLNGLVSDTIHESRYLTVVYYE